MSTPNQENPFHQKGEELPDYSEDSLQAAPKPAWFKDPRRIRWLIRFAVIAAVLSALVPSYRVIKERRASALLRDSGNAFAVGDSARGVSLLKQALSLSPGSARIQHAVELYNARSGDAPSLEKLTARMRAGFSEEEELLGIAEIAARTDQRELAREALGLISGKSPKGNFLRRSLLEASLEERAGNPLKAAEFCIQRAGESPSRDDAGYLRIQAALDLLSMRDAPDAGRILDLLRGVIADRSGASLSAWRIMAGIVLSHPNGISVPDAEVARLVAVFPSLRGGKSADELMAADLSIKSAPESRADVVAKLIKSRRLSPRDAQLDLARWLNGRGFHKEVIAMAGPDRSTNDTDWLLVVMDAKTSLGSWNEIAGMLASPSASGIQDGVRHLYLARIAMMRGDNESAEDEWRNVGASLHLEKPEILAYIAGYEEQIGEYEKAARTYREMSLRESTKVNGLVGLIRCQAADAPASKLIPIYEELVAALPGNQDAACDLAYLRLLSGEDVPHEADVAEKLFHEQPNALTRISVTALARLRRGDPKGALDLYSDKQIDWNDAAPSWRAVRCAVLKANLREEESRELESTIHSGLLRPEERALLGESYHGKESGRH